MPDRVTLESIVHAARRIPSPTERAAFLDWACRGDLDARARAGHMINALDAAGTFIVQTQDVDTDAAGSDRRGEAPGAMIGPYRLLELIGEGGFGSVFLAEQREPVQRKVALKIIKPGMDSQEVSVRFEAERQALANMDHTGVARMFDAGTTATGRPYFVMEFVRGEPLTAFCDKHRLAIDDRLALFIEVCEAVQHAHTKGVVHRDLKPGNVLVAYDAEGRGRPKVIDFGVAKALHQPLTEHTLFTERGQLIGTPEYMSPEQAEMSGTDIDTRSDIYSLGVMLYELLIGLRPYDREVLRQAGLAEIVRILREVDPPKPSTRLGSLLSSRDTAAAASEVVQARRVDARSLSAALRRDLDWVVMKCLEKDRARRYETASALALDLRRYLNSEPILAGPPSAAYRLRKFVNRNRGLVVSTITVAAVVVLGAVGTTWGMLWALDEQERSQAQTRIAEAHAREAQSQAEQARLAETEQRRLAQAEASARAEEERERKTAQAINTFVTRALVSADPNQGGAQAFLVTDAMAQALKLLDAGELRDQPATEAALRLTISEILDGNAQSAEALRNAERALELNQALHPGDHRDVAASLNNIAAALEKLGRPAEALAKYEAALEMCQRLYTGDHPNVAANLNNVGLCLYALGRPAEALPKHEAALEMYRRLLGGDHQLVAMILCNVALCLDALGQFEEALPKHQAVLEMRQRLLDRDHPEIATALSNLSACLNLLGRTEEALLKNDAALEMYQRLFKGDHPAIAAGLNNSATFLARLERHADAVLKLEAALGMYQRLYPGDHPSVAQSLNNLARCLDSVDRSAEALPKFEAALAMRQRLFSGDHPVVAASLRAVAECLRSLGRAAEALPKHEACLQMFKRLSPRNDADVADSLSHVAFCLNALGRAAEAATRFQAALDLYGDIVPPDDPNRIGAQVGLAEALVMLGRLADAERLLRDAAASCERSVECRRAHERSVLLAFVHLYDTWRTVEPDKGYAAQAAAWRARLDTWRPAPQPAPPPTAPATPRPAGS